MSNKAKINQVILLIVDDVKSSQFFHLLERGTLPNLKQLADTGTSCKYCITSFPSVTFPCYPNIVTGAYSGYYPEEGSGIPAYHWVARTDPPTIKKRLPFIRNYSVGTHIAKIGSDLADNVKTIFEQAGDGNFLSSLNIVYRGSYIVPPYEFNTESVFKNIEKAYNSPEEFFDNKEIPTITVGYVPKTDSLLHEKGFDHPEYIQELIKVDRCVGSLMNVLKKRGYYDSTAICLISDHGNYKAKNVYDLEPFFEKKGLVPYNPKKKEGDFDASFGSVGHFNFPGETWHHHPSINQMRHFSPTATTKELDLFQMLWEIPGVKLMYYRDDKNSSKKGKIHIQRKDEKTGKICTAYIEYKGMGSTLETKYTYEDDDIFGYENSERAQQLLDDKFHSIDDWLSGTYDIDFPLLIDQIPRYFKNPRSSDILVSTLGKYCMNYEHGETKNEHLYSHDLAIKESMTVPLIIGGSEDIPHLQIDFCKTTDIVPTLLKLLGHSPHKSVVGKDLFR
ncbi:MAG: Type I phosphodiesterase / nucleotide pyrophosphatase [Promethearchaeota archaeon]|nr:MAG: Type I phosphodiesterase / nucleotide pyrophosphatase [Candidatus Lokiarchaeota archaeon]